jgi:predicted amidohydrolase YtcJ
MKQFFSLCGFLCALTLTAFNLSANPYADTIYSGGPILTIDDKMPRADAVAVANGKILAVGNSDRVMALKGPDTEIFDLSGYTLLPGFVDSHGHVVMGGMQARSANLLAPPDGEVVDIQGLLATLSDWLSANRAIVDEDQLLIGFGYDQSQLKELRHPTRDELDTVSTSLPIIIIHQSGHFGVANSKALELSGISADSPNPDGGIIRKRDNGEPDGVLEENAFFAVLGKLQARSGERGLRAYAAAGPALWARYGYTTAQEGRATPAVTEIMKQMAAEGAFNIDIVAYPDVMVDRDYIKNNVSMNYTNRTRVGGAKLTIDGSPQGFTAYRDRPYYAPVGHYTSDYRGYAAVTSEQVMDALDWAFENDIQILTHANGEAASDLLIAAVKDASRKHGKADRRPVLIHGQFLREDQVDSLKALQIFPSVFPMHTFYWGDWHRDHTVGPVNADNISPTGWLRTRDMIFGSHHDAPVAFPDSMRVLDATVTRRTRSGDILGPAQRVDVMTALKAMTIWPAWQHFEEDQKGSIETGKLADFVILSADPTAVDPETLDSLKVLTTIKEDKVVFSVQ